MLYQSFQIRSNALIQLRSLIVQLTFVLNSTPIDPGTSRFTMKDMATIRELKNW